MGTQEDRLPDAIGKRHKVISLSEGGSLTLTRWTLAKTMIMSSWMAGAIKDMTGIDAKNLVGDDFMDTAKRFVTVLGDKLPEFLGLAVDPIDRGTVNDLPADDALEVLEAVIELNITAKFLGKVKGLLGRFKSMLPAQMEKPVSKST